MKTFKVNLLLEMVASLEKPLDIAIDYGILTDYFGLEGKTDEVKIYDVALSADEIKTNFQQVKIFSPELQPRRLPCLENNPKKFGAFYTT